MNIEYVDNDRLVYAKSLDDGDVAILSHAETKHVVLVCMKVSEQPRLVVIGHLPGEEQVVKLGDYWNDAGNMTVQPIKATLILGDD
jgi:hypothetical protein